MAGLFCTSCNLETVLTSAAGPFDVVVGAPTINVGAGPAGNNTVTIPPSTYVKIGASGVSIGAGVGVAMSNAPPAEVVLAMVQTNAEVLFLTVDQNGVLRWGISGTATVAVSPSGTFPFDGSRRYVEFGVSPFVSGNETLTLQYEGTVVGTDSGKLNGTAYTALSFGNRDDTAPFSPTGLLLSYNLDSFYMLNSTGTRNNALLGKRVVTRRVSAGPGQYSQFIAVPPALADWQSVGAIPPVANQFAMDNVPGDQLAVALGNVQGLAAVDFVMGRVIACQDVPSTRGIMLGIGDGTTLLYGPPRVLTTSYQNFNAVYDQDPISNSAWTLTNLMARQAAVQTI